MAWGTDLPKIATAGRPPLPSDEKCDNKIILYVTAEEKALYQQRAAEKSDSVSNYIRKNLGPITDKLRALYAGKAQQEKEN